MSVDSKHIPPVECSPLGDAAVIIRLGEKIDPVTHCRVKTLLDFLEKNVLPGVIECIPAFTTVAIFYDPVKVRDWEPDLHVKRSSYEIVVSCIKQIVSRLDHSGDAQARTVEIPVCYGGDFGPDLEFVARHNKLTPEEVIAIHSGGEYLVYMIGFAPGFPYLGGMSERIATPRRETPRLAIPAGSVGIAGMQTGVYPIETPGGWQLIGRTPLRLFRPDEHPPSLLQAGDLIRFRPISRKEFEEYKGREG